MSTSTPHLPRSFPRPRKRDLGGSRGNQLLTSINAAVLVVLLAVQGATLLALGDLMPVHLFVGVVLLGPVALKLASTGYRVVRYYTGAAEYREAGPPPMVLRVIAPVFVLATIGLFGSGLAMLLDGTDSSPASGIHGTSVWIWGACLGVHALFNAREMIEAFRSGRHRAAGAELRAALVLGSLLGGLALALALLSKISGFES